MIHEDRKQFIDVINITVQRTGFRAPLLEKDYYLTLILSRVHEISDDLIFKGGTCLNKIYYSYYRLVRIWILACGCRVHDDPRQSP